MRILVTVSDLKRLALVLDLSNGHYESIPVRPEFIDETVRGRAPCRPFGISWSLSEVYIANNKQLLVLDKNLNYLRTSPVSLQVNIHQLAFFDQRVWAVSPWTNSLIGVHPDRDVPALEFCLLTDMMRPYCQQSGTDDDDEYHFNSVLWSNGGLYIGAHCFGGPSFIKCYRDQPLKLDKTLTGIGHAIHGIAYDRGVLYWLSTNTREIRSSSGVKIPLQRAGYARGFGMTEDFYVVAISEYLSRTQRVTGDSWVQQICRNTGEMVREFHLPSTGSINDLRIVDCYDFGHCVMPLWNE